MSNYSTQWRNAEDLELFDIIRWDDEYREIADVSIKFAVRFEMRDSDGVKRCSGYLNCKDKVEVDVDRSIANAALADARKVVMSDNFSLKAVKKTLKLYL